MQHLYFGKNSNFAADFYTPNHKNRCTNVQRNPLVSKIGQHLYIIIKDKEVYMTLQYKKTTYNKQRLQLCI